MKRTILAVVALLAVLLLTGTALAQSATTATVLRNANLRAGPGTTYAVVGSVRAGDVVTIVDTNPAGDWYKLEGDKWIAAFLVSPGQETATTPTRTPRPAATPAPVSSRDLLRYLTMAETPMTSLAGAMSDVATLLQNPRLGDNDWVIDLAVAFYIIRDEHAKLLAITPPPSVTALHRQVIAATQDCNDATYAIATGIDEFDVDELERGAALLLTCAEKTKTANAMLTAAMATPTPTARPRATPTRTPRP